MTMPGFKADSRLLVIHPKYEGVSLSDDGTEIHCAPEHEQFVRLMMKEPDILASLRTMPMLWPQTECDAG